MRNCLRSSAVVKDHTRFAPPDTPTALPSAAPVFFRPGLSLPTVPLINGSRAASRRSICRASFQHAGQLPHKVAEHSAQDGGDYD